MELLPRSDVAVLLPGQLMEMFPRPALVENLACETGQISVELISNSD